MPLAEGEVFAGYTVVRRLGGGGMGEVYLAQHPRLPRRDALKLLARDLSVDASFRERFLREADLASTLWHPHIVGVHDRGEYDGQLWISMDFVDGRDAGHLLSQQFPAGMPEKLVIEIVTAVAAALDYAHKQGLLHRDVKPGNIMVTNVDDDDERRILLTDFGIARMVDDISGLTATNFTVGTVAYTAPEQLTGEDIDGRADQYSLAATAYHLFTGSQPFPHSNPAVVIGRHLNQAPPACADTRPELAAFDPVLSTALAKNPRDRFPRCADFARALAEQSAPERATTRAAPTVAASTPPSAPTTQAAPQPAAPQPQVVRGPRRQWRIALVAVAAIGLIGTLVFVWRPWAHRSTSAAVAPIPASSTAAAGNPPPPSQSSSAPPRIYPASAIDTLLLTPVQISTTAGGVFRGQTGADMVVTNSSYGMSDHANQVDPPSCVGVIFGADPSVYNGTGFEAIRDQTLDVSSYTTGDQIEQTVVVFPTAEQAQAVLTSQTNQWRACANRPNPYPPPARALQIGQRHGEGGYSWTLADVQVGDDLITVKMAGYDNEAGIDQVCQQALGVRASVVIKTKACQDISQSYRGNPVFTDTSMAGDYAELLANTMLNRVAQAPPAQSPATALTVDGQGFVGHSARCDPGNSLAALIRTAQSLAVVCQTTPGNFYYHGERLSDGANIKLPNAVRSADGFDVTNPADGTLYKVRPDRLTIISNGHVDSSESALQYASGS
jgi:serine/threonine protein kinase